VTWLYGEGQTASNDVYKVKLDAFKKIGLPIKERHRFLSEYPVYLTQFGNYGQEMHDRIAAASLSDEQRNEILNKHGEMQNYFTIISEVVATKKEYEDVGFSIDEVHTKYDTFKQDVNKIFAQPPKVEPVPVVETTTGEEKPEEADAEMKVEDENKEAPLWWWEQPQH